MKKSFESSFDTIAIPEVFQNLYSNIAGYLVKKLSAVMKKFELQPV